ncbi:hypothetical protein BHU72_11640 [Desulfuribacillus stibiiarsenatis]|uniref:Prepilin type IV endopeptidase peptidase domain-containing protein n=1 Tax=Desulfuribacillus stibiiarsenatis TaxID=1390249 RepID=A0A1E5L8A9_9FIRM|nr:prepilin peptidase [Desulfuribacillus stibiiarsenatis]OEH86183.1 hypothetical protein BHU72_11640 [Desulfuribacillus stibiiarsenatis]
MILDILLLLVLIICTITDIRERKIYNKIIFPSLAVTILWHTMEAGWAGLGTSLLGFVMGLLLLLIPFMLGGMGAGDVKLLALIGAIKGYAFVLTTAVYMALIGGTIAIVILSRKDAWNIIRSLGYYLSAIQCGMKVPLVALDSQNMKTTYPYGVAIALGAVISLFTKGWLL